MKKISPVLILALLVGVLLASGAAYSGNPQFTITGKITQETDGFYIQGTSPASVFRILNPDTKTLEKYASSGQTVRVKAESVMGDNIKILSINGKSYKGGK